MKQPRYGRGVAILIICVLFIAFITAFDRLGFALILMVLGAAFGMLLFSLTSQIKNALVRPAYRPRSKDFSLKFSATLMGFFLVVGTALYLYVFWKIGQSEIDIYTINHETKAVKFNNAEYFLRSLICSLDLFMLDVDSNILDRLDNEPIIKAVISIHAVLSFSCTIMMLVSLVYSRLNAYFKLAYRTKIDGSHNHLYLFFGINKPTETLVKQIIENDAEAIIVLIDEANVKDDVTDDWDGIVGLVTHKRKTFEIAEKYAVRIAVAGKELCDIDEAITSLPDFDALGYLGLYRIEKLINKLRTTAGAELHIFFLNENEGRNIRNIITLAKDKTIKEIADSSAVRLEIYCHARYNGPNRVIQDVALNKNLNIKIIDSSHIAVERLKLLPEFHPFNVVEMDDDNVGTVKDSFDALIVGFGEVGRDAFRFLYEFAAFIDNSASGGNARRSRFNCTIVDKDLQQIEGTFKAGMPGVFRNSNCKIDFQAIDYNHKSFFEEILSPARIKALNYVVISIGNNDEAISLATRVFNRFRQCGGDLSKLIILVRCTDDYKVESIKKIADHYNNGYGKGKENTPVIRIFGQTAEIYTYELVISNRLEEMGKLFHENYRKIRGEKETWEIRHKKLAGTSVPNLDKLRKIRRQESQDMANALHIQTKMAFFNAAMPTDQDRESFRLRYFKADGTPNRAGNKSNIRYTELSERENLIVLRLAILEHLRWNAAHELLGYVRRDDGMPACDERELKHNCLKNWDELDKESLLTEKGDYPCDYKELDFAVIDTTIFMSIK